MDKPIILAVDHDPSDLGVLERQLGNRYGHDYMVLSRRSAHGALALLRQVRADGGTVALVFADPRLPDMEAVAFFRETRRIEPRAKRVMLADRSDRVAAGDVRHGSLQRVVAAASDGAVAVRNCQGFLTDASHEPRPRRAA